MDNALVCKNTTVSPLGEHTNCYCLVIPRTIKLKKRDKNYASFILLKKKENNAEIFGRGIIRIPCSKSVRGLTFSFGESEVRDRRSSVGDVGRRPLRDAFINRLRRRIELYTCAREQSVVSTPTIERVVNVSVVIVEGW